MYINEKDRLTPVPFVTEKSNSCTDKIVQIISVWINFTHRTFPSFFKSDGENMKSIVEICKQFIGDKEIAAMKREPLGTVNTTYQIETIDETYIVQKIGSSVFEKNSGALEVNYRNFMNAYVRRKSAIESFAIPQWIPAADGHMIFQNQRGECWRMYRYLRGDNLGTLAMDNRVTIFAEAVAAMHTLLQDITVVPQRTINHFHDITHYFNEYLLLRPERVRDVECEAIIQKEINFILDNCIFEDNCVIHGDTKIGNILYDIETKRVSFIDLDTFSYSSKLIDIADSIRSIANTGGDIPDNPEKVGFDIASCMQFLRCYLDTSPSLLEGKELLQIPFAILRLPFELGLRFYMDYLANDQYFTVDYEEQNLMRARCQFKLYQQMLDGGVLSVLDSLSYI